MQFFFRPRSNSVQQGPPYHHMRQRQNYLSGVYSFRRYLLCLFGFLSQVLGVSLLWMSRIVFRAKNKGYMSIKTFLHKVNDVNFEADSYHPSNLDTLPLPNLPNARSLNEARNPKPQTQTPNPARSLYSAWLLLVKVHRLRHRGGLLGRHCTPGHGEAASSDFNGEMS